MNKRRSKETGTWVSTKYVNDALFTNAIIESVDNKTTFPIGNSAVAIQFIAELLCIKGIISSDELSSILDTSSINGLFDLLYSIGDADGRWWEEIWDCKNRWG